MSFKVALLLRNHWHGPAEIASCMRTKTTFAEWFT